MLVALTGASGFIGSYTAKALHRAGHTVRAMVRVGSRREHIEPYVSEWRVGDLSDAESHAGLVSGSDAVIHAAADWSMMEQEPSLCFERNLLASLSLLEVSRMAGVRQFMFVSSVAVYHEILEDRALDENHPTWPNTVYGGYKAAVEPYLKTYHFKYGMNTSSWRPAAVYGIDPVLERSQWYELIRLAKEGKRVSTSHGGKITHVEDVADALTAAVGDPKVGGHFYNLVDQYMYWQQAGEFAKEISGSDAVIVDRKGKGPRNEFDTMKAVEFFERHGNSKGLRRGMEGVREYVSELLGRM